LRTRNLSRLWSCDKVSYHHLEYYKYSIAKGWT
jgi:hypothetical protein